MANFNSAKLKLFFTNLIVIRTTLLIELLYVGRCEENMILDPW